MLHAFQPGAPRRQRKPRTARADGDTAGARRYFCAFCKTRIASEADTIDMAGAHQHHVVNPAGAAFDIGCFRVAPGCRVDGEPTVEHTWFAGYAWSYALCANCRAHLGWCYEGNGRFFGLILARLEGPL